MRSLWLGILLAAVESLAFGQLDSDTLTVSVSQSTNLQRDQIAVDIRLITPMSSGLDEVLATLKSAGITSANFLNVYSTSDRASLYWVFTLAVPVSKFPATAAQLNSQGVIFFVQGPQVSAESQQAQQCPVSSLMAAATARAKQVADAAELAVGDILAITGGNVLTANTRITPAVPTAVVRLDQAVIGPPPITPTASATCSLTVKFKLLRYH
jgi:hypothetical protein